MYVVNIRFHESFPFDITYAFYLQNFRMFRANEDIRNMFVRFRHLKTEDEIRVSELVEKHAISVMGTLDELISNIDNVDYVFDVLKATGQSHMKFPGFRTELIWVGVQKLICCCIYQIFYYFGGKTITNVRMIVYLYFQYALFAVLFVVC